MISSKFIFLYLFCVKWAYGAYYDKVLLRDVQVLTFKQGERTTGRRSSPVRQIDCEKGCDLYVPDAIQCYNKGSDGSDVNWRCEAELPNGISMYDTTVGCEGYDYPDDPYILKGSCQVSFSLKGSGTSYNSNSHGNHWNSHFNSGFSKPYSYINSFFNRDSNSYYSRDSNSSYGESSMFPSLKSIILWGLVIYVVWYFFFSHSTGHTTAYSGNTYQQPPQQPHHGGGFFSHFGLNNQKYPSYSSNSSGSGMGFWSGMGIGGLLGSLFARRSGTNSGSHTNTRPQNHWGTGYGSGSSSYAGGSGYTSGGNINNDKDNNSGTRTATSYATTKRR